MMLQFEQDLADDESAQSAISWIRQSGFTTRFFYDRMMVYAPNGSVGAECFSRAEIIAFARRQTPANRPTMTPSEATPAQIRDLEEANRYLRDRWRMAIAQRDEWERRAVAAERAAAELRAAAVTGGGGFGQAGLGGTGTQKYQQLRRFIAREFHPDQVAESAADREQRAELFKILWAEVSRIDKG
jgi:hypothetical protein